MEIDRTISSLLEKIDRASSLSSDVIPWSSPIPVFGKINSSKIATLGLNPSNREFVDQIGNELCGPDRRFHTLNSLSIESWGHAKPDHIEAIRNTYNEYFHINPYDNWFAQLDGLINGANASYYGTHTITACHLDLVPFATFKKWSALSSTTKNKLSFLCSTEIANTLKASPIKLIILNGQSVVNIFEEIAELTLEKKLISNWALPRKKSRDIPGYSYRGNLDELQGVNLNGSIKVIGYNHNIQSSFGVTTTIRKNIREWISKEIKNTNLNE